MLARREYTRQELERKLAPYADDPEEISDLLVDFERRGWLSEQRVVEQLIATRRRRYGTRRIAHELREKGVSEAAIAGALPQLKDSELDAARAIWRRKFGGAPVDARGKARQIRFLQGRGFSLDTIRHLLRDVEE